MNVRLSVACQKLALTDLIDSTRSSPVGILRTKAAPAMMTVQGIRPLAAGKKYGSKRGRLREIGDPNRQLRLIYIQHCPDDR